MVIPKYIAVNEPGKHDGIPNPLKSNAGNLPSMTIQPHGNERTPSPLNIGDLPQIDYLGNGSAGWPEPRGVSVDTADVGVDKSDENSHESDNSEERNANTGENYIKRVQILQHHHELPKTELQSKSDELANTAAQLRVETDARARLQQQVETLQEQAVVLVIALLTAITKFTMKIQHTEEFD